jgi:Flp pilus assembly protein TadD
LDALNRPPGGTLPASSSADPLAAIQATDTSGDPQAGETALEAAFRLHAAGRLAEAEPAYRRALADDPAEPRALLLLGRLLVGTGRAA